MFFRCRAALSGHKLKLREQTRTHTTEAALEINIESSFVEIARMPIQLIATLKYRRGDDWLTNNRSADSDIDANSRFYKRTLKEKKESRNSSE